MGKRKDVLKGTTHKIKTGCGNIYTTINEDDDGKPFEIFIKIGKAGTCAMSHSEALGRITSLYLQSGGSPAEVVKHLRGISCHQQQGFGMNKIASCADAVGKSLEFYLGKFKSEDDVVDVKPPKTTEKSFEDVAKEVSKKRSKTSSGACPDCGGQIVMEEGCEKCPSCGFTKC